MIRLLSFRSQLRPVYAALMATSMLTLSIANETKEASGEAIGPELEGLSLLSVGKPSYGVRLPNFEGEKLVSITDIEVLTKLADGKLRIEKMVFTTFDEEESIDMIVEIEQGIYNAEDELLTSEHETVIRGDGFRAVGEGCIFRQGSALLELTGVVHSEFAEDLAVPTGNSSAEADSDSTVDNDAAAAQKSASKAPQEEDSPPKGE